MTKNESDLKKKILELEALLKAAEDNASLGVWEWDLETNYITFSKEALEISCIDPDKFDGSIDYIAENIIHKDFKAKMQEALQVALLERKIAKMEYRLACPGGITKWVRVNGVFLFDDDGNPLKMTGMVQDISSLKYYESQIESDAEFLDTLLDIIQNPIFYKDSEGKYQFCNTAFSEYLGIPKRKIIGSTVYDVAPGDLADVYHKADLDLMSSKGHQIYEAQVKYADGSLHDVIFNKAVHMDYSGEVMGLVGVMLDITAQNRIKKQIDDMNKLKEALIEINQNIVNYTSVKHMYKDLLKSLVEVIDAAEGGCIIEVSENDVLTISECVFSEMIGGCSLSRVIDSTVLGKYIKSHIHQSTLLANGDTLVDGNEKFVLCTNEHVRSRILMPIVYDDNMTHIIAIASSRENAFNESVLDLTDYVLEQTPIMYQVYSLYQKTLYLSQYDALTALMNRHHFESVFSDRLNIAERDHTDLILATFDLNGLKQVNDKYGHHAGDLYIKAFADLVIAQFRKADRFARTGGDEFSAIFLGADLKNLFDKLQRLQEQFSKTPIAYNDNEIYGSFSFGIASYPNEASTQLELEKLADERMYEDKMKFRE